MTQTTPKLALIKPGGGSTGLNTPPDRVDIDVLNGNFDKIDYYATKVGDNTDRSVQFYGPAANIGTTTPKLGDTYQESDSGKRLWRYDGATWVAGEFGLVRVRPTSVTGTGISITPTGTVVYDNSAVGGRVNIDGVLNFAKYRRFRVMHTFRKATPNAMASFIFRGGGTDRTQPAYFINQIQTINGAFSTTHTTSATNLAGTLEGTGSIMSACLELSMVDTKQAVLLQGTVIGRYGGMESKTVFADYEGTDVATVDGIGITYGQSAHAEWSFYAYVD